MCTVTQQFNTTTSMGRLTLNVPLSFAQFEREVTGERIRDKIAASKKKGMWMGGMPPLGYHASHRKLVIVESEAETVRHIFRRYAALGSVRLLQEELELRGITSKRWTSAAGRSWGGKPISRGTLYLMLQNRLYRGDIVHKDLIYPGEHRPIIDETLWMAVQTRLSDNAVERGMGIGVRNPSLLTGLLFDGKGHRMTPTHAVKSGRNYRYYVSRPLIAKARADAAAGLRIPAAEIEQIVADRLRRLLCEPARIHEIIARQIHEPALQQSLMVRAAALARDWPRLSPQRLRVILLALIQRIEVCPEEVVIRCCAHRLSVILDDRLGLVPDVSEDEHLVLSAPAHLRRAGKEIRMIIDGADPFAPAPRANPVLVKALARAYHFHDRLMQQQGGKFGELAQAAKLNRSYVARLLRLAYLAPDITAAILEGRQPPGLTATKLIEHPNLPLGWEQ